MEPNVPASEQLMSQSKKARALLIALGNLNLVYFLSPAIGISITVTTQMITAILFLTSVYVGVQGGIEMVQSFKIDKPKE